MMQTVKILMVIHGYPPHYMAGSEVYTYKLTRAIAAIPGTSVHVFSRVEDPYLPPYTVIEEVYNGIPITRVNKNIRDYLFKDKYLDPRLDGIFLDVLEREKPDIVHIGHLSHLSTSIVKIIKEKQIPVVFTLHDYWMICLRGQMITPTLELCSKASVEACSKCMGYYFYTADEAKKRFSDAVLHFKEINQMIDMFIAPSRFLRDMYVNHGIPGEKIVYMDYGFDVEPFKNISREKSNVIRFGFTGRIIPVKGVDLLVEAMEKIDPGKATLKIYGKNGEGFYLKQKIESLPHVEYKGGYHNDDIAKIYSEIDVLVVPSIWYENSPLVIHEAFLAGIPVITTNLGGMSELVKHERNGLLFTRKDVDDLALQMQQFIDRPELLERFTEPLTPVRTIEQDAAEIVQIYMNLLNIKPRW